MKQRAIELLKANLAIFFAELFNALNINSQKYLLPEWSSPVTMFLLRSGFALLVFWIISFAINKKTKERPVPIQDKLKMILAGILFLSGYIIFYLYGVEKSSQIDSALLFTTMPVFVLLLSHFFFQDRITTRKLLGLLLALSGTTWVIVEQNSHGQTSVNTLAGNLFCLISALSYAFYLITNKQFVKRYGIFTILKWVFTGAFIVSVILTIIKGFDARVLTAGTEPRALLILIFVLIFPTVLTYILLPYGLKKLNTVTAAIYDYEVPVVATFIAVIFMNEPLAFYQIISAIFIFTGVFFVSSEKQN
ncbi:MAG: DMT family transporter [Bacteroidales bacterium]